MMVETFQSVFQDLGSQEPQTDYHDGLRIRQQRDGLRVEILDRSRMIAESMYGKKVDKTLTVHVELGKTSLNFRSRS